MNAIVVDDSRAMRTLLRRTLVEFGYVVEEACDGVDALEKVGGLDGLGLALVDWNMPRMDGLELIKQLRAESRFAGLPIVMVTSETEIERVRAALAAGASEFVMKPFTADILRAKLEHLGLPTAA